MVGVCEVWGGLRRRTGKATVVLNAHGDGGGDVWRGDVGGLGGVYVDELVGGGVVGGAGCDLEVEIFRVAHLS